MDNGVIEPNQSIDPKAISDQDKITQKISNLEDELIKIKNRTIEPQTQPDDEFNLSEFKENIKKMSVSDRENMIKEFAPEVVKVFKNDENWENFLELCNKHNIKFGDFKK